MRGEAPLASILIIDDYLLLRKNLEAILMLAGYEVQSAAHASEAFCLLSTSEIDLIVTDVMLPGMDGLEFCQQIRSRERWRHIPFIFLSGNLDKLHEVQFQTASDNIVCLSKPFNVQNLLDTIAGVLAPARTK